MEMTPKPPGTSRLELNQNFFKWVCWFSFLVSLSIYHQLYAKISTFKNKYRLKKQTDGGFFISTGKFWLRIRKIGEPNKNNKRNRLSAQNDLFRENKHYSEHDHAHTHIYIFISLERSEHESSEKRDSSTIQKARNESTRSKRLWGIKTASLSSDYV